MVRGCWWCARRGVDGPRHGGERLGGKGGGGGVSVASVPWARVAVLQALDDVEAEGTVAAEGRRLRRGGHLHGFCARGAVAREASLRAAAKAAESFSPAESEAAGRTAWSSAVLASDAAASKWRRGRAIGSRVARVDACLSARPNARCLDPFWGVDSYV